MDLNIFHLLDPIKKVLEKGNQSMKWINAYSNGQTIPIILQDSMRLMKEEEAASKTKTKKRDCL